MKKFFVITIFLSAYILSAQEIPSSEKRIYLVDLTKSMEGMGGNAVILPEVKRQLSEAILDIEDTTTEVVIIPFTDHPFEAIRGYSSEKDSLAALVRNLKVRRGDTNIADAWSVGVDEMDSTKICYLFMLTDGIHNFGPTKEELYARLEQWQIDAANTYYFAFYVMLTPQAREQPICDIVAQTDKMWLIESMNIGLSLVQTPLVYMVNVYRSKSFNIPIKAKANRLFKGGTADLSVVLTIDDNPYYSLCDYKFNLEKPLLSMTLKEKMPIDSIPAIYPIHLKYSYNKDDFPLLFFTPEIFTVEVSNYADRIMTLKEKED